MLTMKLIKFVFIVIYWKYCGCEYILLINNWKITSQNGSIALADQKLPSGVYSALENAGIVGSILSSYNDVNLRWIARENWTYSLNFDLPNDANNYGRKVLVFHGIDTVANIVLNGQSLLPNPNNMFVRYEYDVNDIVKQQNNILQVSIESPIIAAARFASQNKVTPPNCPPYRYNGECHMNFLRKMQASFAWDWGLAAPSLGIWKPVVLELTNDPLIRDVIYDLSLDKDFWVINITSYLDTSHWSRLNHPIDGFLTINLEGFPNVSTTKHIFVHPVESNEKVINAIIKIKTSSIIQWWPNGYGPQKLYDLNVTYVSSNRNVLTNEVKASNSQTKSVRIGFRTIELVENQIDDGNGFSFKINGISIFMKGTNWIPLDILPEKMFNVTKMKRLLKSVQEAHMNVIRVWGGGIYETDEFYKLTDEYGILVWHDMMFACAMYPVFFEFIETIKIEIKQNVRRIQNHPSILLWAGNNENEAALVQNWYGTNSDRRRFENEYIFLYDTIREIVQESDNWHLWLYSSPSNGNKSQVINRNPQDNNFGDIHFYNYLSDGWDSSIYPKPRFVSEYGFQSIPSINNIERSLYPSDDIQQLVDHRQHFPFGSEPIISLITKHLNLPPINDTQYMNVLVYYSQLSQAIATKTETETYRVGRYHEWNTMGALYWQLNDVWTAPSWSSIEYDGNFKILHYWVKEFFAPLHVVINVDVLKKVNIYAIRDTLGDRKSYSVQLDIYKWSSLKKEESYNWNIKMEQNSVSLIDQRSIDEYMTNSLTRQNSFMIVSLLTDQNEIVARNFLLLDKIKNSKNIINPNLRITFVDSKCDPSTGEQAVEAKVTVNSPALFVYIQIKHPQITLYDLSKNGFIQVDDEEHVTITFSNEQCSIKLTAENVCISTINDFISY